MAGNSTGMTCDHTWHNVPQESGTMDSAPEIETPTVLQAFVQPYEDMRYVTTYMNAGTHVTCHSFSRRFSRRYSPLTAAAAAHADTTAADVAAALGTAPEASGSARDGGGSVDPALRMQLRKMITHLVNYVQRAHGLVLGM